MLRKDRLPLERVARTLCGVDGLPENTRLEGAPMWRSFEDKARAALDASGVGVLAALAEDIARTDGATGEVQARAEAALAYYRTGRWPKPSSR